MDSSGHLASRPQPAGSTGSQGHLDAVSQGGSPKKSQQNESESQSQSQIQIQVQIQSQSRTALAPIRQPSIPIPNALLSTINAARQRLPMCAECEKSLPNQIVFDKVSCC